ncbi:MAG: hypothetical protein HZB51_10645 [Chloroflexi bacterium]|nr:hypothetical protein [Chloroflexota bacterium]
MPPLMVEIIAYAPTQFYHCAHCEVVWNATEVSSVKKWHQENLETSMPPDMMQEYRNLSDWVINAAEHYGGRVVFKVVDAASMEGIWKSLKYRVHKYPAIVIDGKGSSLGTDFRRAEALIDQRLMLQPTPV